MPAVDEALQAPDVLTPLPPECGDDRRNFQGIPGIECTPGGTFYATWYTGGDREGTDNYVVLARSDDGAQTWAPPCLAVMPHFDNVRTYDPTLWTDPRGRLWLFWAQSADWYDGRAGVWAIVTDDPDAPAPTWSEPRRLANGIMMNKPIACTNGDWLLPAAVWKSVQPHRPELAAERLSNVVASTDEGATWALRGGAAIPETQFDEHSVVERRDGRLWILARCFYGIGQSFSADGGRTWTPGEPSGITGPSTRAQVRRLQSGRLLLLYHFGCATADDGSPLRSHLTAKLSDDDGATWSHGLVLDERAGVSYPDVTQDATGRIHVIYDYNRGNETALGIERQILCAAVTEEDILAGRLVDADSRLRVLVNQATGPSHRAP